MRVKVCGGEEGAESSAFSVPPDIVTSTCETGLTVFKKVTH